MARASLACLAPLAQRDAALIERLAADWCHPGNHHATLLTGMALAETHLPQGRPDAAQAAWAQRRGGWLMGLVWGIADSGLALKLPDRLLSTTLQLPFGWRVLVVARPMINSLPAAGRDLLVAGGVANSLAVLFVLLHRRLPCSHLLWHLFVVTGRRTGYLGRVGPREPPAISSSEAGSGTAVFAVPFSS